MVNRENEELLKDRIFAIFNEFKEELSHNRREAKLVQLCDQLSRWCGDYLFEKDGIGKKMGLEIISTAPRIIKKENIVKFAEDKNGFFKYLYVSLKNAKAEYHRKFNEKETIKISRDKKKKLREIKELVIMYESEFGRKLKPDEIKRYVSDWFDSLEYTNLVKMLNISSTFSDKDDEGNEVDIINTTVPPYYSENIPLNPLEYCLIKLNTQVIRDAVKSVLNKKQGRTKQCNKAIFTLYCIEKIRNYEVLDRVLDRKIIKKYGKITKKLTQYEIYRDHHPGVTIASAHARASEMLNDFLQDLEAYLKENNPEIFPKNH